MAIDISFMKEMLCFVVIVSCRGLGLSWRTLLTLSSKSISWYLPGKFQLIVTKC